MRAYPHVHTCTHTCAEAHTGTHMCIPPPPSFLGGATAVGSEPRAPPETTPVTVRTMEEPGREGPALSEAQPSLRLLPAICKDPPSLLHACDLVLRGRRAVTCRGCGFSALVAKLGGWGSGRGGGACRRDFLGGPGSGGGRRWGARVCRVVAFAAGAAPPDGEVSDDRFVPVLEAEALVPEAAPRGLASGAVTWRDAGRGERGPRESPLGGTPSPRAARCTPGPTNRCALEFVSNGRRRTALSLQCPGTNNKQ